MYSQHYLGIMIVIIVSIREIEIPYDSCPRIFFPFAFASVQTFPGLLELLSTQEVPIRAAWADYVTRVIYDVLMVKLWISLLNT